MIYSLTVFQGLSNPNGQLLVDLVKICQIRTGHYLVTEIRKKLRPGHLGSRFKQVMGWGEFLEKVWLIQILTKGSCRGKFLIS